MLDVSSTGTVWRIFRSIQIVTPHDVGEAHYTHLGYVEKWRKSYKTFTDIPERTRANVAALSMCIPGEALPGIGQKVSANTFWLDENNEILEEYNDVL